MKKKRPVLQDVADRVGVTKMTVSRFLRNPEQVSVALRGKIAAALDELGYIPNRAPDILSNATSRAIGIVQSGRMTISRPRVSVSLYIFSCGKCAAEEPNTS